MRPRRSGQNAQLEKRRRHSRRIVAKVARWHEREKKEQYDLTTIDGDVVRLTLADFFLDNTLHPKDEAEIRALAVGETFRGGGGAAPEWSIRRVL
jgi:hypothetical protein